MSFVVLQPGPLTTFQAIEHPHVSAFGLSTGGPMDIRSCVLANRLVSNEFSCSVLEITLGGFRAKALSDITVAITGAYTPLHINGRAVSAWRTHALKKGDELSIGHAIAGVRAYLAVTGGWQAPTVQGRTSTVVREGLQNPVARGDVITPFSGNHSTLYAVPPYQRIALPSEAVLDFIPSDQWMQFSASARHTWLSDSFHISPQSDRMGVRLRGQILECQSQTLLSEGIAAGAIQVTGAGEPIVLMRDRQTLGGYPKLGCLTTAAQDTLAQLRPGSKVRFQQKSPEQGLQGFRSYWQAFQDLPLQSLTR